MEKVQVEIFKMVWESFDLMGQIVINISNLKVTKFISKTLETKCGSINKDKYKILSANTICCKTRTLPQLFASAIVSILHSFIFLGIVN